MYTCKMQFRGHLIDGGSVFSRRKILHSIMSIASAWTGL